MKIDEINEEFLLREVLKLKNKSLKTILRKMAPIFDMFSKDVENIKCNSNENDCNIKILDSSLIIFMELFEVLQENSKTINDKIKCNLKKENDYAMILSLLLSNLLKHILAYRKIYISGFIVSANVILRSIIELSELITAMLHDNKLFNKYLEYSTNQRKTSLWRKHLSPSQIREILSEFDEGNFPNVDIASRRKTNYNYLSKNTHNEFKALSCEETDNSLKILLTSCYIFLLQIHYLLLNSYHIDLTNQDKTGDYTLHLEVFCLLFEKIL